MRLALSCLIIAVSFIFITPALALAPVKEVTSNSGLKAWLIEDHNNPIVAVKISFKVGSSLDPIGLEGLARLAASTMDEGAGKWDSQGFQSRLEDLSISLHFDAGMDNFSGNVLTLRENLQPALDMLRTALLQPRFDDVAVDRIRSQILSGLRQSEEDPDTIAALSLYKSILKDHPYGRGSKGTISGFEKIKQADLKNFVQTSLAKDNLVVGITGDIDEAEVKLLLDQTFAGLPAHAKIATLAEPATTFDNNLVVINKPVPQSSILFAQRGIDRHDKDFYAAYVLNYILGGGSFASRLYEEVREKRGLVYSVYSYLVNYDKTNLWIAGAGTQNARVKETLDVVRADWARLQKDGATLEEVTNAKTYLTGSFPLRFKSSETIAAILVGMQQDNLPIDFLKTRNAEVEAVTLKDVNRVAKTLLDPANLKAVVVGQPKGL
jgi:zinc protease